jgi:hypothetical protein
VRRFFRVCLVACLSGCGTSAGAEAIDAGAKDARPGAPVPLSVDDAEASTPLRDAAAADVLTDGDADAGATRRVIPVADPEGGACPALPTDYPGLVRFGSDPGPYGFYLASDAGVVVGACPAPSDFPGPKCECCWYDGCGPLLPAVVRGLTDAAPSLVDEAGSDSCCFWVRLQYLV